MHKNQNDKNTSNLTKSSMNTTTGSLQTCLRNLTLLIFLPLSAHSEVLPAPVFSDHMVLQRDMPVPVWGSASPGEKVTVSFHGKSSSAAADQSGKWRVILDRMEASASPATMAISSNAPGAKEKKIEDVLVGEVWLGAGQSNMAMIAQQIFGNGILTNSIPEPKPGEKAPDPNLKALIDAAPYPQVRLIAPIVNYKTNEVALRWVPSTRENLIRYSAQFQAFGVQLSQKLNVPVGLMMAAYGGSPVARWITPAMIRDSPECQKCLATANAAFSLEKEQQKFNEAQKRYEADLAEWNKLPHAQKTGKQPPHPPGPVVKPGEATRWTVGDFHDQLLAPFIGYGIRAILWDQGESGAMLRGVDYGASMTALIQGWRKEWGQGEIPFLYVQKPSGMGCSFDATDKVLGWASDPFQPLPPTVPADNRAVAREDFINIAKNPKTFMVPVSDLGSGIHPGNKFGYAARDVQVALGTVYNQPVEVSGPVFAGFKVEGNKVRIQFTHVGKGLVFRNGEKLQGFALAGVDKKWVWANADISGDEVVLSHPQITSPLYVRYAWDFDIRWANLFNKDGLPALSFETDL
jgi:sialate O-acetylesterase